MYNQSTAEADGDNVKNIYAWKVNGAPFEILNLPFEGESTTSLTQDYSYLNHTVTAESAPTWYNTGGHDNWGYYAFKDNPDAIRVPYFETTGNSGEQISAFMWMKKDFNDQPYNQNLLAHNDWGNSQRSWAIGLSESTDLLVQVILFEDGAGAAKKQFYGDTIVSDLDWHHVGFVWDTGVLKLYVDGEEETVTAVTNDTFTTVHLSTADVIVGSQLSNNGATFDGSQAIFLQFEATLKDKNIIVKKILLPDGDDNWLITIKVTKDKEELLEEIEKTLETFSRNIENSNQVNLSSIESSKIPKWVKDTMKWYVEGQISEDEMITVLEFLIGQNVIKISNFQ